MFSKSAIVQTAIDCQRHTAELEEICTVLQTLNPNDTEDCSNFLQSATTTIKVIIEEVATYNAALNLQVGEAAIKEEVDSAERAVRGVLAAIRKFFEVYDGFKARHTK